MPLGELSRVFYSIRQYPVEMKSIVILIYLIVLKSIKATLITNANFAFQVFSPQSLVRFFEFSDAGWNISQECIQNMYGYLSGLQNDQKWAYKCELDNN